MSFTIAITGKGGVGKTTLSALLVSRLIATGHAPVLAVDADPNSCLDTSLGVKAEHTIGGVREEAREIAGKGMAVGVSKQELLEFKIAESLVEADDFDLIAMGRPEGPGCYCYANNVLKQAIGTIAESYPYIVIDNEAGLENLSRRIVHKVDLMIMVADPSMRGIETLERLYELTHEMEIKFDSLAFVINRMRREELPEAVKRLHTKTGANYLIGLPDDEEIANFAEAGKNLLMLSQNNQVSMKIDGLLAKALTKLEIRN